MIKRVIYFVNHDWAQIKSICALLNITSGVTINGESRLPDDFGNEDFLKELVNKKNIQIRYKDVAK